MFDIPDAKRVRRSELFTRSPSPASSTRSTSESPSDHDPDNSLQALLQARLAGIYGPLSFATAKSTLQSSITVKKRPRPVGHQDAHRNTRVQGEDASSDAEGVEIAAEDIANEERQTDEAGFEFRLFSTPSKTKTGAQESTIQRIILHDPNDEEYGEGGFVVRDRDRRYYFAERAQGYRRAEIESVAFTGEEVLSWRAKRAWGLEVPWRIKVLRVRVPKGMEMSELLDKEGRKVEGAKELIDGDGETRRKRPGKKRRILLRERRKKRDLVTEQGRREREEKEEAEREKRTRRNREKKVKRKMKEKAKKVGEGSVHSEAEGNELRVVSQEVPKMVQLVKCSFET